jgi:hypothetical protein
MLYSQKEYKWLPHRKIYLLEVLTLENKQAEQGLKKKSSLLMAGKEWGLSQGKSFFQVWLGGEIRVVVIRI